MRYRLLPKQGTETFQRIYNGRKWVGRVVLHADGKRYLGIIGKITVYQSTDIAAFEEVAARAMGYASAAAVKAQNAEVRQQRTAAKRTARHVVGELLRGNFEPFDRILGIKK